MCKPQNQTDLIKSYNMQMKKSIENVILWKGR